MDNVQRKIIITEGGQQIPVQTTPNVKVMVFMPDDPTKEEIDIDVTASEFEKIKKQALTNKIPTAILRGKKTK